MTDETERVDRLLWLVHDDFMDWLRDQTENTVSIDKKIDRLMLGLASFAKALAGGYHEGGLRQ